MRCPTRREGFFLGDVGSSGGFSGLGGSPTLLSASGEASLAGAAVFLVFLPVCLFLGAGSWLASTSLVAAFGFEAEERFLREVKAGEGASGVVS